MKRNCKWCDKEFDGNEEDNCCNDDNCIKKWNLGQTGVEIVRKKALFRLKPFVSPNLGRTHTKEAREKMSGKNHWNYLDGRSIERKLYCNKFNENLKERCRIKFHQLLGERKCFECGKLESNNGRKLDVHHVYYNENMCCDDSERILIPLCICCHLKTNVPSNRIHWTSYFIKKLNEIPSFNGECWISKEEYSNYKRSIYT